MIIMRVLVQVKPECGQEFEMYFAEMLPDLAKHPGIIQMDLSRSTEREGEYLLIEKYSDEGAFHYHKVCPSCMEFSNRVNQLLNGEPECSRYEEAAVLGTYKN